jgi:hypothetical protein
MSQPNLKLFALLTAVTILGSACSSDPDPDVGTNPTDTGVSDAGFADTGNNPSDTGVDSGNPNDSGVDGGNPNDAGDSGFDGGNPNDSGFDGGTPADGGDTDGGPLTCNPSFGQANACGGDPRGNWNYGVGCTDADIYGQIAALCPLITVANQVVSSAGTVELTGTATAGQFTRDVRSQISADVTVPLACGFSCAMIELAINSQQNFDATCPASGTNCACVITRTLTTNDIGTWDVSGGILNVNNGARDDEFYYCVSGGDMIYRGTANNTRDHDFVYLLTP